MNIKFNIKDKIKSKDILDKTIISFLSWDSDGKAFHLWERLLVISYIHVLFFFLDTEKSVLNNGLWAKIMTIFRLVPWKLHLNREDNKDHKMGGLGPWMTTWITIPPPHPEAHPSCKPTLNCEWQISFCCLMPLGLFVIRDRLPWPIQYPFFIDNTVAEFNQNPWVVELLDPWILDELNSGETFKIFIIERLIMPQNF